MSDKDKFHDEKSYSQLVTPIIYPEHWISSGSLVLDSVIGRGFPKRKLIHIYGPSKSRKTTLVISALAQAQKHMVEGRPQYRCMYHSGEDGFLEEMAIYFGVDLNLLRFKEVTTVEDYFTSLRNFMERCVLDKVLPFGVLDSLSSLSVNQELFAGIKHTDHYPPHARKISQGWRTNIHNLRRTGATLFVISHEKPTGVGGGASTDFYASLVLQMVGKYPIYKVHEKPESGEIGYCSNVKIVKSRGSSVGKVVPFRFYYRPDPIDHVMDMWYFLDIQEIVQRKDGGWMNLSPYISKSFYMKDWPDIYEKYKDKWPEVVENFYTKRYAEYCKLAKIDPTKHLDQYLASIDQDTKQSEGLLVDDSRGELHDE